jgi:Mycobacterium membrane protein
VTGCLAALAIVLLLGTVFTRVLLLRRARTKAMHAQSDSVCISCRIIIDGLIDDERSVKTVNAHTFCLDKSG